MKHKIEGQLEDIEVNFNMDDTQLMELTINGKTFFLTEKEAIELANLIMNNYYGI